MNLRRALILTAILVLPLAATACGHSKAPDRPPPMFGKDKDKAKEALAKQKAEEDAAKKKGADAPLPPPPNAPIGSGPLAPPAPPQ